MGIRNARGSMNLHRHEPLRPVRDVRPSQDYRELRTDVPDITDVLQDEHHILAEEQLIPQVVKHQRKAVAVDRIPFYFYQKFKVGRRCSCWGVETSPDGACQVCFKTGIVGGFNKFGTFSEVIDVTYPGLNLVNCHPNFEQGTRPVMIVMEDTANYCAMETQIEIKQSLNKVDCVQVIGRTVPGKSFIKGYIKLPSETVWTELNKETLEARLGYGKIFRIRIEMTRRDASVVQPLFSHLLMRYNTISDLRILGDLERRSESITLADYGIFDSYSSISIYFDDTVKSFTTEDFLVRLDDNTRWKIIESKPNRPLRITTSHDITARLVQEYENYSRFPI